MFSGDVAFVSRSACGGALACHRLPVRREKRLVGPLTDSSRCRIRLCTVWIDVRISGEASLMDALLYFAAAVIGVGGFAHLVATRGVVTGFGELTPDNRRIITMEWTFEGVTLISLGMLVALVTVVDATSAASSAAYAVTIATLLGLAFVSLLTGFRAAFLPFRLCPFIFGAAAALITAGAWR